MTKELVLFDHDGGLDDYLATMLLMTMEHIDLLGIVVTPADCYIKPAVSATRKILDLMDCTNIPVAESTVRGLNPFPRQFRRTSFSVNLLPILNQQETIKTKLVPETGQAFMARVLQEASEPVTILSIGPLTTIATALTLAPNLETKIKQLIWMGGALNVPGNVNPTMEGGQDGSMEWNVYWDPLAAYKIWQTNIPITLCPLDITNTVPVTPQFVRQLGRQRQYPISDLAGQCYAMVMFQAYWFWDVLTTAYLGRPDLFELCEWETELIPTGPSQGRTRIKLGGRKIMAMNKVDTNRFYKYVLEQWAC